MSFHEKSAWACLIGILAVYLPYFYFVLQYPVAYIGLFIVAVVKLVVLLTAFHLVNALLSPDIRKRGDNPPLDERDKSIELTAAKVSGFVLAMLVMIWCLNAWIGIPLVAISAAGDLSSADTGDQTLVDFTVPAVDALRAVHILFAGFVAANVVYYAMIIFGYRRVGG